MAAQAADGWVRLRGALAELKTKSIKALRSAFKSVQVVLDDEQCCEQVTARDARGAIAGHSAWAHTCEVILRALKDLLERSRSQSTAQTARDPLIVLKKAVVAASRGSGLRNPALVDEILSFCIDSLQNEDVYDELSGDLVQIVRGLLDSTHHHAVPAPLLKSALKLCISRLDEIYDTPPRTYEAIDPGAPLADLLYLFLRSARFDVTDKQQLDILAHVQLWLTPRSDSDSIAIDLLAKTTQVVLDVVSAFISARGRAFFPALAANVDTVPSFVARSVHTLSPTSPLRVSALRCLHAQLTLVADRAASWGADAANPFGSKSKGSLLDKSAKIAKDLFGAAESSTSNSPSKKMQEIVSAYNPDYDNAGLQAHLHLAVDLIFWFGNTDNQIHDLPSLDRIITFLASSAIGPRHLEFETIAWLQILAVYLSRHPLDASRAQSILRVLHHRLSNVAMASEEPKWILRCCEQLAQNLRAACHDHLQWAPLWRTLVTRTLKQLPRTNRDDGLRLTVILLTNDLVNATTAGGAIEPVCHVCELSLDRNLAIETGNNESLFAEPSVATLHALAALFRCASLPGPQDKQFRVVVLEWVIKVMNNLKKRPAPQNVLDALAVLLVALTCRTNSPWVPYPVLPRTCLGPTPQSDPAPVSVSQITSMITHDAEVACQTLLADEISKRAGDIGEKIQSPESNERDVRYASQLAFIIGKLSQQDQSSRIGIEALVASRTLLPSLLRAFGKSSRTLSSREQRITAAALAANPALVSLDRSKRPHFTSGIFDNDGAGEAIASISRTLAVIQKSHQVLMESQAPPEKIAPLSSSGDATGARASKRQRLDANGNGSATSLSQTSQQSDGSASALRRLPFAKPPSKKPRATFSRPNADSDDDDDDDDDDDFADDFDDEFAASKPKTPMKRGLSGSSSFSSSVAEVGAADLAESDTEIHLFEDSGASDAVVNVVPDETDTISGERIEVKEVLELTRNLLCILFALHSTPDARLRLFESFLLNSNGVEKTSQIPNRDFVVICIQVLNASLEDIAQLAYCNKLGDLLDSWNEQACPKGLRIIVAAADVFKSEMEILLAISRALTSFTSLLAKLDASIVRSSWCQDTTAVVQKAWFMDEELGSAFILKCDQVEYNFSIRACQEGSRDSCHPMPEEIQLNICDTIVHLAELWLAQECKRGKKAATYLIFNACRDTASFNLRVRATECAAPLLGRLKRKSPLNVLTRFILVFPAKSETLRGLRASLTMVDEGAVPGSDENEQWLVDDDGDEDEEEPAARSVMALDPDVMVRARGERTGRRVYFKCIQRSYEHLWADEMVFVNWSLLAVLACSSPVLLRPVIFRLVIFAAANTGDKSATGHRTECLELRRCLLQKLMRRISLAHACPHMFLAHSDFLLMNWVRYAQWAATDPLHRFPCFLFDDIDKKKAGNFHLVAIPRVYVGLLLYRGIEAGQDLSDRIKKMYCLDGPMNQVSTVMEELRWEIFGYLGVLPGAALWKAFERKWNFTRDRATYSIPNQTRALRYALDTITMPGGAFGPFRNLCAGDIVEFSNRGFGRSFLQGQANVTELVVHLNARVQLSMGDTLPTLLVMLDWFKSAEVFADQPLALAASLDLVLFVLRRARANEDCNSPEEADSSLLDDGLICLSTLTEAGMAAKTCESTMARHVLAVLATLRDLRLACHDSHEQRKRRLDKLLKHWTEDLVAKVPSVHMVLRLRPGARVTMTPLQREEHEDTSKLACLVDAFKKDAGLLLLLHMNPVVYTPACLLALQGIDAYVEDTERMLKDPMLGPATLILGSLLHEDVPIQVREKAAECLGAVGCIDKSVTDLFRVGVERKGQSMARHDGVHELVSHLVCAVRSPDVPISAAALQALRCLGNGGELNDVDAKAELDGNSLKRFTELSSAYRDIRLEEQLHLDSHLATVLTRRTVDRLFADFPQEKHLSSSNAFQVHGCLWTAFASPFDAWVRRLAFAMCNNRWASHTEPLQYCRELAAVDARFAQLVLPRVVSKIVESGDSEIIGELAKVFGECLETLGNLRAASASVDKLRVILDCLTFSRRRFVQDGLGQKQALRDPLAARLDPIVIARAALRCELPSLALLYLEHFADSKECSPTLRADLMFESYEKLGSVEDLDGVGFSDALTKLHFAKRNWLTALVGADGALARGNGQGQGSLGVHGSSLAWGREWDSSSTFNSDTSAQALPTQASHFDESVRGEREILAGALRSLGLFHLLDMVNPNPAESEWRMSRSRASLDRTVDWKSLDVVFSEALRAMRSRSTAQLSRVLKHGSREATQRMAASMQSGECSRGIYESLQALQQIRELGQAYRCAEKNDLDETIAMWDRQLARFRRLRFEHGEPLMALRTSVLVANKADTELHVVAASSFARKQNKPEVARNMLLMHGDRAANSAEFAMERACVMWDLGEAVAALDVCRQVISTEQKRKPCPILVISKVMLQGSRWNADLSLAPSAEIRSGFEAAATLAKRAKSEEQEAACRSALARYLDLLYRTLHARVESPEWARKAASQTKLEDQLKKAREELCASGKSDKTDLKRLVAQLVKVVEPANERRREEKLVLTYRQQLAEQLRQAIVLSAETPLSFVFRLLGLWFDHLGDEAVAKEAMQVPTSCLLPLSYQIASRVGFDDSLNEFLVKLAREQPYDTYPHIFALAKGDYIPNAQRLRKFATRDQAKLSAAKIIAERVKHNFPEVQALDCLLSALTELAYHSGPSSRKYQERTRDQRTTECAKFVHYFAAYQKSGNPVPLLGPHEVVEDIEETFRITDSGINAPKIVTLKMASGVKRRILLKGTDDLRQDAVVEQLFGLVQHLLREARLSIRTYKVVPLTPVAGLIEWVENTLPLASYLVSTQTRSAGEDTSAHHRYAERHDWSHLLCMRRMIDAHSGARAAKSRGGQTSSGSSRRSSRSDSTQLSVQGAYANVCAHFRPVMRYFFLEKFPSPPEWYLRRREYTQSVAVNSMVGHIFGVGDRHLQNILIDETTAELVHIDFGVLFEFGKTLATPERVPFRLTRDLVDGMPAKSTAGTFEKTCERTMGILRDNHELITTISDVLVHDPIYNWTVRTKKGPEGEDDADTRALAADDETSESRAKRKNEVAENVLARIREKLHGREDTGGENLNVKGHVRRLIQQARDPENLAHMFPGWASWV
ncbi:Serine/threonine-protein kinase ATM [Hondaea fermentalgiana]|uniref:non-specific serine/threonine protein kinase n=1 Tax=Hondaea fermentalgiana TaxID=2315210 RepID=A0A2R5G1K8_9STRA|nr:Serine/threonine-protein kinase ATM [Hondaea fermentalgiana]|eukprot:GBG24907.1 Serine/threonine-protein kinase ATM [Hondaea fermentalgiana]